MSNLFFTADCHLGHDRIRIHCNRPWPTIDEMDNALIARWNAIVNKDDTTYIVGDFVMIKKDPNIENMKRYRHYFHALNGRKILIKGNHDGMSKEVYRECFSEVHEGILDKVIDHQKMTFCHYPMRSWNCSFHGAWHFFGHVHGRLPDHPSSLSTDVGVDVKEWNYTPVPWEILRNKMIEKQMVWADYWHKNDKSWKV
jgi:calcineurin-like phosphoesterase family protein